MKSVKYLVLIALGLAIIATVAHLQREAIVRNLTNSVLSGQGFTATEVSVETLGTDELLLSELILLQDDGTRYEISGLSFPLSFPSMQPESISIDQVSMISAPAESNRLPLAEMLQNFLQLPVNVPNTTVSVSRFTMTDGPELENIIWRSESREQHLTFGVQSVDFDLHVDRVNDDRHEVTIRAESTIDSDALLSMLVVQREETGFSIAGNASTSLSPWWSALHSAGWVGNDVSSLVGIIDSEISINLYNDEAQQDTVSAQLTLVEELTVDASTNTATTIRLRANSTSPVKIDFEYPALKWAAELGQLNVVVAGAPDRDIAIGLNDIACDSDLQCTFHARSETGSIELESVELDNAVLSAPVFFSIDDDGWNVSSDRMELVLDARNNRYGIVASTTIVFKDVQIRDDGMSVDANVSLLPGANRLIWGDNTLAMFYFRGELALRENEVTGSFVLFDGSNSFSANLQASHDLITGEGSVLIDDAALLLDNRPLSRRMPEWPYDWDIISGAMRADLKLNWVTASASAEFSGSLNWHADTLTGNYGDIVFAGLSTALGGSLNSADGILLSPSSITVDLIDVGVPVRNIAADFLIDPTDQVVRVDDVSMIALGGEFVIDPFLFDMKAGRNDIMLRPQSIQLQFMVDLADFDDITMSGSISGMLPMTIIEDSVTISDGRLDSDEPGGVIRYGASINPDAPAIPATELGLVTRALSNFQFESLSSDVDYTGNGDLKLQMILTGMNPDMDDRQPVILNLGVENNIPRLLRSLQATRTIEDILERKSAN